MLKQFEMSLTFAEILNKDTRSLREPNIAREIRRRRSMMDTEIYQNQWSELFKPPSLSNKKWWWLDDTSHTNQVVIEVTIDSTYTFTL